MAGTPLRQHKGKIKLKGHKRHNVMKKNICVSSNAIDFDGVKASITIAIATPQVK